MHQKVMLKTAKRDLYRECGNLEKVDLKGRLQSLKMISETS